MGAVVNNLAKGGGEPKGVGDFIQSCGAGSASFWVVYLGDDPPNGTGHWGVSTQGSYMDHWEVAHVISGRKLVVTTFGDGKEGGRV